MRRILRTIVVSALTAALAIGVAWATIGVMPVGVGDHPSTNPAVPGVTPENIGAAMNGPSGQQLAGGLFLVGASKVTIAPKSVAEGGPWIRHGVDGNCAGQSTVYTPLSNPSCLRTFDSNWATGVDNASGLGVYVRALVISNGKDTVAMAVMDTIGWFAGYPASICGDCGAKAIGQSLEASRGIPANNIVISSTHTHASADTVMASPKWYFELVRDATKQAITQAYDTMEPATLQTGSTFAKAFNTDRRIITRAVPDYELGWVRAVAAAPTDPAKPTIATMATLSVHPTITAGNADLHSGLVGHMARRLSQQWGGETLFMPAGLGDQTVNRGFGRDGMGEGLADLILESQAQSGYSLQSNDIVSARKSLTIPADNLSLVGANQGGVFVRDSTIPGDFASGPSATSQSKGGANTPSCVSAAPFSAITTVGGFRIGTPGKIKTRDAQGQWVIPPGDRGDSIVIMQSPGEAFASIALTTKDYLSRARSVLFIGLANDQVGYIIPAEQYDLRGANAAGLAQPSARITNYEESLSLGRCAGDMVQNGLLEIGDTLGVMGDGERR